MTKKDLIKHITEFYGLPFKVTQSLTSSTRIVFLSPTKVELFVIFLNKVRHNKWELGNNISPSFEHYEKLKRNNNG